MVWQHLISIIDKEKFFGAGTVAPSRGNLDGKLTKTEA
jgi:hypothetical protein